jgi:multiple sugar transport system substrate-binding protein
MDNDQTVFQSSNPPTQPAEPVNTSQFPFVPPTIQQPIQPISRPTSPEPFIKTPVIEEPIIEASSIQSPFMPPVSAVQREMPSEPLVQAPIPEVSSFVAQVPSEPFVSAPTEQVKAQEPLIVAPLSQAPPKNPGGSKLPLVKKIVKAGIGLVVVILVLTLLFAVIIPKLFGNSNTKVTLTYWGLWEDSKTMQSLINGFERQNPDITINYSQQDIKQYRERLLTRIADGNGPDIFRFHNSWYPMYAGILLPLPSDTITPADFKKTFYPVASNDLIQNGGIYGIPLEIDTLVLYTNSQLFQAAGLQPPTNWNDFISDARAITVKDTDGKIKTAGAAMGTSDNITHAPDILSLLFLQNGVNLLKTQDASDRAVNALTFYTAFATDNNNVWDNTLDPSILAFSKGNLAMYFGYSWDYFTIKQNNPGLNFQIVPVPQLPNQNVNFASYWAEGVSVKTKHQKEALLFMKYLAQKSTEEGLYAEQAKTRAFGEPYARIDLGSTLKTNPILSSVVSEAPTAFSSPFVDGTFDNGLNQQLNTYLGNAVNGVINGDSAQTTLETFANGVSQVLQKYGQ